MGVLKRIGSGVLVMCLVSAASADGETIENDDSKATERTSSQVIETTKADAKEVKPSNPPKKESAEPKEEPLERLVLDEKIDGEVNIALPQDI